MDTTEEWRNILKPKSPREQENIKKRGFILTDGKWKFKISIVDILNKYNEEGEDTNIFKNSITSLLNNVMNDVEIYLNTFNDFENTEHLLDEFQNIIDEFEMLDEYPEDEEIDYILNLLYDFADDNNIWIESH